MTTSRRKPCPTPGRRSYGTRAAAERRRPVVPGTRRPLVFPYECECGFWHVGNQREPQGPRVTCPTPLKVGFATEDAANRRAANLSALHGVEINSYLCKCEWWHLTSHAER